MWPEMHCDFCAPEQVENGCPACCRAVADRVWRDRQTGLEGVPRVLAVQLRRGHETRQPAWVE